MTDLSPYARRITNVVVQQMLIPVIVVASSLIRPRNNSYSLAHSGIVREERLRFGAGQMYEKRMRQRDLRAELA